MRVCVKVFVCRCNVMNICLSFYVVDFDKFRSRVRSPATSQTFGPEVKIESAYFTNSTFHFARADGARVTSAETNSPLDLFAS